MHCVLGVNGCRYGTYKLVQKQPDGDKLTGFTRVLHRMTDDEVMGEVRQQESTSTTATWRQPSRVPYTGALVLWHSVGITLNAQSGRLVGVIRVDVGGGGDESTST